MTAQGPDLRALANTLRAHAWGQDYDCACGEWSGKWYYHADHLALVISALERAADTEGENVTLHADRSLPPDLATALAELAQATVASTPSRSYAVRVCERGVIACQAVGPHTEHDLVEHPFVQPQDGTADAQMVSYAAEGEKAEGRYPTPRADSMSSSIQPMPSPYRSAS